MATNTTHQIEVAAIQGWPDMRAELFGAIAHRFRRVEVRERARRYLAALLDHVERKNGWQLAEAIGESGPPGVQRLLTAVAWDADAVRDECPPGRLREYVVEHLGDASSGILIVDEAASSRRAPSPAVLGGNTPARRVTPSTIRSAPTRAGVAWLRGCGDDRDARRPGMETQQSV